MWGRWSRANAEKRPPPSICALFSTAHLSVRRPDIPPPNTLYSLFFFFSFFASLILSSSYCSLTHHFSLSPCPSSPFSLAILLFFLPWHHVALLHPPLRSSSSRLSPSTFPVFATTNLLRFSLLVSPAIGFLSPLVSRGQRQWVPAHTSDQSRAAGLPSHCW